MTDVPSPAALQQATGEAAQFGIRTGANDDLVRGEWVQQRAIALDKAASTPRARPIPEDDL